MECAYWMAIILSCLNVLRICEVGSLSFVASSFIEGMCVVALAPDANTISGATFQPLASCEPKTVPTFSLNLSKMLVDIF